MNGWGAKRRGKREFRNVKQKISTLVCLTRIFWNREHLWDQSVKIPTTPPSWVSNNQWRMSITSSTSILTSLLALWFIHTFPSVNLVVRLIKSNQRSHLSRSLEQDLSNKRKKKKAHWSCHNNHGPFTSWLPTFKGGRIWRVTWKDRRRGSSTFLWNTKERSPVYSTVQ